MKILFILLILIAIALGIGGLLLLKFLFFRR